MLVCFLKNPASCQKHEVCKCGFAAWRLTAELLAGVQLPCFVAIAVWVQCASVCLDCWVTSPTFVKYRLLRGEKKHPWNQVFVQLVNSSVVLKGSLRVYICSFLFPCSTSYSNFSLKIALHVRLCTLCWLDVSDISTVPPAPVTRGTNWSPCAEITLHVPIPGSPSVLPSCLLQFTLLGGQPEVPIVYFPGL